MLHFWREFLRDKEKGKEKGKQPIMDVSRQDFINSSIDNKLTFMFDELRCIKRDQMSVNRGLVSLEKVLTGMGQKLGQVAQVSNQHADLLKTLSY